MNKLKNNYYGLKIIKLNILSFILLERLSVPIAIAEPNLQEISTNLIEQISSISPLITMLGYIIGIAITLVSIMQFKAYRDDPIKTPISKPIIYLLLGCILLFLPELIDLVGSLLFGEATQTGWTFKGVIH